MDESKQGQIPQEEQQETIVTPEVKIGPGSRVLLIEDTDSYAEVGEETFRNMGLEVSRAKTFEEFKEMVEREQPAVVVTDLFFPSEVSPKAKYEPTIAEKLEALIVKLSPQGKEAFEKEKARAEKDHVAFHKGLIRVEKEMHGYMYKFYREKFPGLVEAFPAIKQLGQLKDWQNLAEEPSGLLVAKHCIEHKIPFIMVSQGDRHIGDFGTVRMSAELFAGEFGDLGDPLPDMMVYGGLDTDKRSIGPWVQAIIGKYHGLASQERIKKYQENLGIQYTITPELVYKQ